MAGGDRDLADQLGELAGAAGVLRALAVHDVLDVTVAGQGRGSGVVVKLAGLAGAAGVRKESKRFFFEKKNQKNFGNS